MGVLKQSISSVSGTTSEPTTPADPNIARSILDDPGEFLNALLPWAISLVFHVMIFLLMFLIVWVVRVTGMEAPLPVSEARLAEYLDDGMAPGLQNPDLQRPDEIVPLNKESTTEQKLDLLSEVAAVNKSDLSIIGIGAGAASGDLTKYGLSTAGLGEGPTFFGLGRGALHARKICYVVDRSGSMVDELDYVKEEVMRSINRLHRVQQFHVIFFSGGPPIEAPPKKFVHAIKEYKKQAFEFLSMIQAGGSTEPSKAMSRAIRQGADLIYFLTDGEFAPTLVEQLKKWNSDQKVRIYTIAFLRRNGEDLLRQIARQNGGEFRFVSEDDLDKIHTTARVYPEASVRHFDGEFVIFSNAKGDPVARKLKDIEAIYVDSVDRFDEFNRAEQAFQQRRYHDAAQKYDKSLGRARGFWKDLIRIRYMQACDAAGEYDLAVKMYIIISQALPEKADLFMPSNFEGVPAERFEEALRLLEQTLPKITDQRAYWQLEALRLTILEQTESDQAAKIARQVIARLRNHKGQDARYRLQIIAIRVEIKHEQYATALEHLDEALENAGERFLPQLIFLKGRCLYGLAQNRDGYVRAGLAFMRVVIHFPKSPLCAQSMYMAGQVHERISRTSKAVELYETCKELAGANDEVVRLADAAVRKAEKLRSQSR